MHNNQEGITIIVPLDTPIDSTFNLLVNLASWFPGCTVIAIQTNNKTTNRILSKRLEGYSIICPRFKLVTYEDFRDQNHLATNILDLVKHYQPEGQRMVWLDETSPPNYNDLRDQLFHYSQSNQITKDLTDADTKQRTQIINSFNWLRKTLHVRSYRLYLSLVNNTLVYATIAGLILGAIQIKYLKDSVFSLDLGSLPFLSYTNPPLELSRIATPDNDSNSKNMETIDKSVNEVDSCNLPFQTVYQGETPKRITISDIDLNLEVTPVAIQDNSWAVHDYVANFAVETDLPNGITGNVGIYGHDRPQAFSSIKRLQENNLIIIETHTYRFYYQITQIYRSLDPSAVGLFYSTKSPQLTLITCDGLFSKQRYAVRAKLIQISLSDCNIR